MRYINNFIKLRELTAEDKYRKAKGLPPKEDESPYDILEKYKDDPMVMFSFRDEYYTKTKRLGMNLTSSYNTPNGVYCYPLDLMWKDFHYGDKNIDYIPFIGKRKPETIVIMRLKGRGLNLQNYTEQDYYNDINILKNKFPDIANVNSYEKSTINYFIKKNIYNEGYKYSYLIWGVTRSIFYEYKGKDIKNTNYWNFIFSKILGYKWIIDEGLGIIHHIEPIQCVIFENSAYDLIDSIDISKVYYKVSKDELSLEGKLTKYVNSVLKNKSSTEKDFNKIKIILKKYPYILNSILSLLLKSSFSFPEFIFIDNKYKPYIIKSSSLCKSYLVGAYQDELNDIILKNNYNAFKELILYLNINVNDLGYGYDKYRDIPLIKACYNEYIRIIKLLLEHPDIDINIQDENGYTPLSIACNNDSIEIVKLLLTRPDIDLDKEYLLTACSNGQIEIVKLLLARPEIDVNVKSMYEKRTPLAIARKMNNKELIDLLEEHGATE